MRALAIVGLVAASLSVVLALVMSWRVWDEARARQASVEAVIEAQREAHRIDVAIRYLNHVRAEPGILRGLVDESRRLRALLDSIGPTTQDPGLAILHLGEIRRLAELALEQLQRDGFDEARAQTRLKPLTDQMRIHESGAQEALQDIVHQRNRDNIAALVDALMLVLGVSLVLLTISALAFWLIVHRIRRPLDEFASAARRFGRGEAGVRLEVSDTAEFGELARVFNQAMEQREGLQLQLQERVKEQRCLYRVLELTIDDRLSVGEVCQQVAEAIPPHLLHAEVASARVRLGEDEYRSRNWAPPAAAISTAISAAIPAAISRDAETIGEVEVAYLEDLPDQPGGEGPFLREERALLDSIAMHLARMLRDRATAESLARTQRLQAVGELTGGVAHDFNNLLTVIQGNAELLQQSFREADPDSAELAGMIDAAARRGAELTQRLLAFARRQPLQPVTVQVNDLLDNVQGLLRRSLGSHVELELKLAEDAWPALIDPTQLETAVLNLAVNARDAMPDGGWLTIETANVHLDAAYAESRTDVTPGDYLMIAASDTGTGIAAGDLERIFEPFFTTKTKGAGTGLGLAMVYGFIKQSHGHVAAYSETGEGTAVRMYLPRALAVDPVVQEEPELDDVECGEASILVVEDDDLVRRYAGDQLKALGYEVRTASNGPEALSVLEQGAPVDVLLTDIVMPGGMNGKDLADAARAMREDLQVVFMSGYTENAIVHHGRLDPGVRLLSKPFRRQELARKVREALAESRDCEDGE